MTTIFERAKLTNDTGIQEFDCEELGEKVYFGKMSAYDFQRFQAIKTQALGSMVQQFTNQNEDITESKQLIELPFRVLELIWVNEDGSKVIDSEEKKEALRNDFSGELVGALSKLAFEACGLVPNKKKQPKKESES